MKSIRDRVILPALYLVLSSFSTALAAEQSSPKEDAQSTSWREQSELLYREGRAHYQEGRYKKALDLFRKAAADGPDGPFHQAIYLLGVTYLTLERYQDAVAPLERTVSLAETQKSEDYIPDEFVAARRDLSIAYSQLERYSEALRQIETALEAAPQDGLLHYYAGQYLYRLGRFDGAMETLLRAVELQPLSRPFDWPERDPAEARYFRITHYRAGYYLGLSRLAKGEAREAAEALKEISDAGVLPSLSDEELEEGVRSISSALAAPPAPGIARSLEDLRRKITQESRRRKREKKRWEIRVSARGEYDSNVILLAERGGVTEIADKDDFRFVFSAGGRFDFWRGESSTLQVDYDFYQNVHSEISDFDLQAHHLRFTFSWQPTPAISLGAAGGANYYRLESDPYLRDFYGMPFVGVHYKPWGYVHLRYRIADEDYRFVLFDPIRDGARQEIEARHYFLSGPAGRHFFVGYLHERDTPDSQLSLPTGVGLDGDLQYNDFQYRANQVEVGVLSPLPGGAVGEASYFFRNEDYSFLNSFAPPAFSERRNDDIHRLEVILRRSLTPSVEVNFRYTSRFNHSNIENFDYRRHILSGGVEFVF